MSTQNETLGDSLPKEIARCQELLKAYEEIGPAGAFGHAMNKNDIEYAVQAIAQGDTVAMITAYNALKGYKA